MLVCSENFALMKQNFQSLSQLTLTNGTMWASSPTNTKGNPIGEVPFAINFIQVQMHLCITDNTNLFRQSAFDVFRVLLFVLFQEP